MLRPRQALAVACLLCAGICGCARYGYAPATATATDDASASALSFSGDNSFSADNSDAASPSERSIDRCPVGCDAEPTGRYCACAEPLTWSAAVEHCASVSLDLVVIDSPQENALVRGLLSQSTLWIGASDRDREGTWTWVSGQPFWREETAAPDPPDQYANWRSDQPDGAEPEDCALMWIDGQWRDTDCDTLRVYVCEAR